MQLDTFTANIIVDGKPLEEYDVVSETPTKVICWVASEEGKVCMSYAMSRLSHFPCILTLVILVIWCPIEVS